MTKEEIASVLAEIDEDLKKAESEAVAELKKADDGSEPEPKESAPAEDSSSPAVDAPPSPPGADSPAGPPDAAPAPGAAPAPAGDPGQEQGLTPEALQAEYAQLPPEELDMHLQAAMAAKEAMAAAGPAAGGMPPAGPAGAPPAGPAAGPAGAPPAAGGMPPEASEPPMPPMGKADLKINKEANGGKITSGGSIKKSEDAVQKLAELVKSQQEDIVILTNAIRTVLEAPVRKSVSSLSEVGLKKSEPVMPKTSKDVEEFIKTNVAKMTKAERDLWLDFKDNKVPASKLAPMLDRLTSTK